jgi:hypothetical protein
MIGAVGPRYQLRRGQLAFNLRAQVAAGWFWVHGHGYMSNSTGRSMSLGLGAGGRVSWERRGVSPWLGLDAMGWPGDHSIAVVGVPDVRQIPALDLMLSIGASFRVW